MEKYKEADFDYVFLPLQSEQSKFLCYPRRCQSMVSDRLIAINTINNNQ